MVMNGVVGCIRMLGMVVVTTALEMTSIVDIIIVLTADPAKEVFLEITGRLGGRGRGGEIAKMITDGVPNQ